MKVQVASDPLLDQLCLGFSVLTWLPVLPRWQALQSTLQQRIPVPLALTPPAQMHVSIQLLIPVREERRDKKGAWQSLNDEARRELRTCGELPTFTLVFEELRVLERAVILVARNDDVVRPIRERFASLLTRAHIPVHRHNIVHATLARYRASGTFEAPELTVDPIHVRVKSLHLVRERSYGLAAYDELAKCVLRDGHMPPTFG